MVIVTFGLQGEEAAARMMRCKAEIGLSRPSQIFPNGVANKTKETQRYATTRHFYGYFGREGLG